MSIIEGAVELIGEMQQKIEAKELELSAKQWLELERDQNFNEARNQLKANAELEDVAELVVQAFKQHGRLKTIFADKLQRLTGGTKRTSIKPFIPKRRRKVLHNKNVDLDLTDDPQHKKVIVEFIEQVGEEAKKARQSGAGKKRRSSWWPWNR